MRPSAKVGGSQEPRDRYGYCKQRVTFFSEAGLEVGWCDADVVLLAWRKVLGRFSRRKQEADRLPGKVVRVVEEHNTSWFGSSVDRPKPCEEQLHREQQATRLEGWQMDLCLVRPAWSQRPASAGPDVVPPGAPAPAPTAGTAARQPHSQQPQSLGPVLPSGQVQQAHQG
ncbi:hypothetical protein QJQ45_003119 [Haematococcus lacustris]|nr:hypothetical protein QJQ45_003119 [Haematococcus lacustris]